MMQGTLPSTKLGGINRAKIMALAFEYFQTKRLVETSRLLDQVLASDPDNAEALDLAGLVALSGGDVATALARTARAASLVNDARYHCNHGVALGHAGQHWAAVEAYAKALSLRPDYPEAHNNRGVALVRIGQNDAAEAAFRAAVDLRANYAEAWMGLGDALQSRNSLREAISAYEHGLSLDPTLPRSALGQAQRCLGRRAAALATYRADVVARPDDPDSLNNLAAALSDAHNEGGEQTADGAGWAEQSRRRRDKLLEAVVCCERAIALRPTFQEAYSNLGNLLRSLNRAAEAEPVLRRAIALRPSDASAYNNLGLVLRELHRHDEALAVLDLGLALAPQDAEIAYSRAAGLLLQGRFEEGWPAYDCRFRIGQAGGSLSIFERKAPWRGEAAGGRTLMLMAEQGMGDTIQFVRYVPMMAERGMRVVVAAQAPLLPLLQTLRGVAEGQVQIINQIGNYPPYDLHCPMLSLPLAFATNLETIPAPKAYLAVPEAAAARWSADPLAGGENRRRLRVGLVWGGNPRHVNDFRRSIPLAVLAPLFHVPDVAWFSLQIGERAEEQYTLPRELLPPDGMTDLAPRITDFAETAAAVAGLDLVISADTAVAHLAGALGKPVWIMLPRAPDWRWLTAGSRSPWYPSVRLFRQDARCRWHQVADDLSEALAEEAKANADISSAARPAASHPAAGSRHPAH
jgi:tetratricopeptide (TPR) repeat protein